jgi:hypothetical protein
MPPVSATLCYAPSHFATAYIAPDFVAASSTPSRSRIDLGARLCSLTHDAHYFIADFISLARFIAASVPHYK